MICDGEGLAVSDGRGRPRRLALSSPKSAALAYDMKP